MVFSMVVGQLEDEQVHGDGEEQNEIVQHQEVR